MQKMNMANKHGGAYRKGLFSPKKSPTKLQEKPKGKQIIGGKLKMQDDNSKTRKLK